jgi:hypothetical protein
MDNNLGTDKIKALLNYGFQVESFIRELSKGFSLLAVPGELVDAIKLLSSVTVALSDAPQALQEWLALSDDESVDIENYVQAAYGASPDGADQAIERVLNFLVQMHSIGALVESFVKK